MRVPSRTPGATLANAGFAMPEESLLRCPAVQKRVGLGRSSLYAAIARGEFPAPIRIGPRAVAWVKSSIDEWIDARIRDARCGLATTATASPTSSAVNRRAADAARRVGATGHRTIVPGPVLRPQASLRK